MKRSPTSVGLAVAVLAAACFGLSGAFAKPLLEAGWSPGAAVTVRALTGGLLLAPIAVYSLRGKWVSLWRGRWRVLGMALLGVAACQLLYFAAIERIPVGTAILLEFMAPLLLVAVAWARTRRLPKTAVLVGSVAALLGLVFVISPSGATSLDLLGLVFALGAMVGCAVYYVVAARPADGLPTVALASFGLLIGGLALGLASVVGLIPFAVTFGRVHLFGESVAWWVPMLVVCVAATAMAYATSIAATSMLGSRLASFAGLLEVIFATFYAWLLLGEELTLLQFLGGALILAGIAFVRSEKADEPAKLRPQPYDAFVP
ncbi:EamA family transporter [Parafrigoribacterium humi]|jgi:drug/metabolite transporter (DMT)-like permease|uniref:EamA family transporter n=1 Tax=Parafrigoribacterium humi TaxID=3144664 RepID=UPI0032EBBC85